MLSNNLSKTYLCGGYLRLSKEDGDVAGSETLQSNSIENQKEYIEDYLQSKPEIKIVDFYVDDGYSGVNFDRPDFQRMLQDIKNKKIDCVIVKDLSRLGRNYIEVGKYIERLFLYWVYVLSQLMIILTVLMIQRHPIISLFLLRI